MSVSVIEKPPVLVVETTALMVVPLTLRARLGAPGTMAGTVMLLVV